MKQQKAGPLRGTGFFARNASERLAADWPPSNYALHFEIDPIHQSRQ
jgi:hypothetical protein